MSFGWSAGDIAAAITLVYNLVEALDSQDGAAGDYREAMSFLRDLKRTLEPLRTFTAWQTYPEYGREIGEQVEHIKEPIGKFLDKVLKYEPSLGAKAAAGHHRHILRKLQWYLFMSKKVSNLRKKIESNMRIIDSLMQRLTLDIVSVTQQRLPNDLRITFEEVLRPELIAVLRENLPPLHPEILEHYQERQIKNHEALVSKLSGYCEGISSNIDTIKLQLRNFNSIGERLKYSIQDRNFRPEDNTTHALLGDQRYPTSLKEVTDQRPEAPKVVVDYESLQEVYYLVFLYLGYFLKNLFLLLLRLVEPSRALVPRLLAKENIIFLDAIGRPPRILPYEYFRCFKVLQAFIQYEFKDLPGSAWVKRGRYIVLSLANNQALDEFTWATITPGARVAMSMVVRKLLNSTSNPKLVQCPERNCSGTWAKDETESWVKCPICHKEVLHSVSSNLDTQHDGNKHHDSPTLSTETPIQKELDVNQDDIAIFKRVVQQIIHSDKPLSPLSVDNLAAYQSALAEAAYAATAKGKLCQNSVATNTTPPEQEDSHPRFILDSSHTSYYKPLPFSPTYEIDDDFDYEDALEDNAIIAAANAEALANDVDGFYGREFGFYSAPKTEEAEYRDGGYFNPRSPIFITCQA